MTPAVAPTRRLAFGAFFRVAIQKRSYLNLLYLLAAFPLGIFYFVFLTTGLSTGLGTVIVWIGLPVLALMMLAWWGLAVLERELTMAALAVDIPPMAAPVPPTATLWERAKAHLLNPTTWKSLVYLLLKFPFGIASFVATVTLVSVSLSLLLAPVMYLFLTWAHGAWGWYETGYFPSIFTGELLTVDGRFDLVVLLKVLPLMPLGMLLSVLTLHTLNFVARCWGEIARGLLGTERAA